MNKRTPNWFFTADRFASGAAWTDRGAGVLVWPACWIEWNVEPALGVRLHRATVGWGRWRVQLDVGRWRPVLLEGPIDWDAMGVDGYLAWARKMFSKPWGRADVERLFNRDPSWKRLTLMGTAHAHYIRVLLARAMLSTQGAPPSVAAVSGAGPDDLLDRPTSLSPSTAAWAQTTSPASGSAPPSSQALLDGLDDLDKNLRRNQAAP